MKGVILAAGEGTRIRNITYGAVPKELLPIGNVPTIRFPIESMKLIGIKNILVVISPDGKQSLVQGLRSGRRFGVNLCYVVQEKDEGEPTGIGKAILSIKNWLGQEDFLVALGDTILCDFSSKNPFDCLAPFLNIHVANDPIASIILHPTSSDPERFGVAKFKDMKYKMGAFYGEIECLVEKPSKELARNLKNNGFNYVVAGYYILKPEIFSYIESTSASIKNEVQITDSLILAIKNGEKVFGVVHGRNHGSKISPCEYWDVGIPEAYKKANRKLIDMNIEKMLLDK